MGGFLQFLILGQNENIKYICFVYRQFSEINYTRAKVKSFLFEKK